MLQWLPSQTHHTYVHTISYISLSLSAWRELRSFWVDRNRLYKSLDFVGHLPRSMQALYHDAVGMGQSKDACPGYTSYNI